MSGHPGTKGGSPPPAILQDRPLSIEKWGERPNKKKANSPLSTHSHTAANLDSSLGVPDLHEVVIRPAGDLLAIRRGSDGEHTERMARHWALRVPDKILLSLLVLLHGADACAGARMAERMHLPMKPASALQTPLPTSAQQVRFPDTFWIALSACTLATHTHLTPLSSPNTQKTTAPTRKYLSRSCFGAWDLVLRVHGLGLSGEG